MEAEIVSRAMAATTALAGELQLRVDDAVVIHNSNKLALHLSPCGVFARVALVGQEVAALEVELALRLAGTASPVAALEPRVEPRVYERDGFAVTMWTYYEGVAPDLDSPGAYADVLQRLHNEVSACYPDIDQILLAECRRLVLAMVAAWRWDIRDEFPDGHQHGRDILSLLRQGPPWPALGTLTAE